MWGTIQPKWILEIEKQKKNIDPIYGPSEVMITHDLHKAKWFNGFIVNLSEDLNK